MDEEIFDEYSIEERDLKHTEAEARLALERKELARAFGAVLSTEDGITVFKQLFNACGYAERMIRINPMTAEINPISTQYNLSKRDVWLDLRKHIAPQYLALIELPGVTEQ